jgi:ATP-binding protein involved in chromosome partitioning
MMQHIIPVISGKGGVGKSTVAVNLAIALAGQNLRVALIDGDFYGPSVPTMFGGGSIQADHNGKLIPAERWGVKYVSLGFFLQDPDDAVIWRGPMFNKALRQMFEDVLWGEIDVCVIDMPPGTGDAQISLSQMVQSTGAVVVTTPQEVALADVRKAISMLSKVNIPVLGIVENMSGLMLPDGSELPVFGKGGGRALADRLGIPLLAEVPLDMAIRSGGDEGVPAATDPASPAGRIFVDLASAVAEMLETGTAEHRAPEILN